MSWQPPSENPSGWQPPQPPPPAPEAPRGAWPPPQHGYVPAPPANSKATTALVLGICGIVLLPLVLSIPALVFGYRARREIDSAPAASGGRGMAVAGIVLGWVGVALGLLIIAFVVLALALDPSFFDDSTGFTVGPGDQVD